MGTVKTLRGHGAVVVAVTLSVINRVILTVIFFYCLRLLLPSGMKSKILSFESIMDKELNLIQLWKSN